MGGVGRPWTVLDQTLTCWYAVFMLTPVVTGSTPGVGSVDSKDVDKLLKLMELGAPYMFDDLMREYIGIAMKAGRQPGHYVPLSKALTARENMVRSRVYVAGKQVRVYTRTS